MPEPLPAQRRPAVSAELQRVENDPSPHAVPRVAASRAGHMPLPSLFDAKSPLIIVRKKAPHRVFSVTQTKYVPSMYSPLATTSAEPHQCSAAHRCGPSHSG